jgi:hypothetical protein
VQVIETRAGVYPRLFLCECKTLKFDNCLAAAPIDSTYYLHLAYDDAQDVRVSDRYKSISLSLFLFLLSQKGTQTKSATSSQMLPPLVVRCIAAVAFLVLWASVHHAPSMRTKESSLESASQEQAAFACSEGRLRFSCVQTASHTAWIESV